MERSGTFWPSRLVEFWNNIAWLEWLRFGCRGLVSFVRIGWGQAVMDWIATECLGTVIYGSLWLLGQGILRFDTVGTFR